LNAVIDKSPHTKTHPDTRHHYQRLGNKSNETHAHALGSGVCLRPNFNVSKLGNFLAINKVKQEEIMLATVKWLSYHFIIMWNGD